MKFDLAFLKGYNSILYFAILKEATNHWIAPYQKKSIKKLPDIQHSLSKRPCTVKKKITIFEKKYAIIYYEAHKFKLRKSFQILGNYRSLNVLFSILSTCPKFGEYYRVTLEWNMHRFYILFQKK